MKRTIKYYNNGENGKISEEEFKLLSQTKTLKLSFVFNGEFSTMMNFSIYDEKGNYEYLISIDITED